jgi:hypothetical protein
MLYLLMVFDAFAVTDRSLRKGHSGDSGNAQ